MTDIRISELPNIPGQQTVELTGFDLLEMAVKDVSSPTGYTSCKGSLITYVTYAQLVAKVAASSLIPGVYYLITDRFNYQSGGVGVPNLAMLGDDRGYILLHAYSQNAFSANSQRSILCPKWYSTGVHATYTMVGIHNDAINRAINEVVIFGGKYWKNKNGNGIGTILNDCQLDTTEWDLLDKATYPTLYTSKGFNCQYSLSNDWVSVQKDRTNTVGVSYNGALTFNPCDITDWNQDEDGSVIQDNYITNGWRNNLNLDTLKNNTVIGAISINKVSNISRNNVLNGSISNNINIDGIVNNIAGSIEDNDYGGYNIQNNIVTNTISDNIYTNAEVAPSTLGFDNITFVYGISGNIGISDISGNKQISCISNNSNIYGVGINDNNPNDYDILAAIVNNTNINGISSIDSDGDDLLVASNSNQSKQISTPVAVGYVVKNNAIGQTITVSANDADLSGAGGELFFHNDKVSLAGGTTDVDTITGLYQGQTIRFYIQAGSIITFNHGTIKMKNGTNLICDSADGAWVEFENRGNVMYHINDGSY